jgi:NAD(P)-dependent dehydrogenase (short-subunit alcohol dehydrogenase family)
VHGGESIMNSGRVTDVLLDFQAVMSQWLELQGVVTSAVMGAAARRREVRAPGPQPRLKPAGPPSGATATDAAVSGVADVPVRAPASSRPVQATRAQTTEGLERGPADHGSTHLTVAVRDCPLGLARGRLAAGHAIVVTDDGQGLAVLVADRLRRDGHQVALISAVGHPEPSPGVFVSPVDSVEEADRVTRQITDAHGPVGALIHLAPLSGAPPFDGLDATSWWNRLSSETRALFLLARSLGSSLQQAARHGGAALISTTSMGGYFGTAGASGSMRPSHGGVVGFTKCVAIEWPEVRVRAIDLDATEAAETLVDHVIAELWTLETHPEIGYRNGRRVCLEVEARPPVLDASFAVPSDGVILATGGARGITAEVCLELAERYQPTFVLVGQSPLPTPSEAPETAGLTAPANLKGVLTARLRAGGAPVTPAIVEKAYRTLLKEREIRDTISRLSAAGARTHYVQLDVQDSSAFGALIDEVYDTYGRIDGVIHGAGIIEDKLVRDKALDSFDRVFRTKTLSAFTLSRHLKPESLRFVVFFSSVAGRFGNRGQADYAAANEVISKLAVVLQEAWSVRVCAIAWAPWDKLGMVSPELTREFARRGVGLLSAAAGRRALWREIQQSPARAAEVVVAGHSHHGLPGSASPAPAPAHDLPLLARTTTTASPDATRFETRLDVSADVYLHHHRLDGQPVLPLAFATELMAEAAQATWPNLRVAAVRELQMLKGIVVDPSPMPATVVVRNDVRRTEDGLTEVTVEIATPSTTPSVRYRSVVQLSSEDAEAPRFEAPSWSLRPMSRPLARAYREWTFHGPLFQRVEGVTGIGPSSIVGPVYSSSAITGLSDVERSTWIIDPFVFDAALQLLLMWSRDQNDKTALPSRFQSFTRYGSLSDRRLTCYVGVQSLADGHALRSTVHFVDEAGRVRAVLEGMEASCAQALNRLAASHSGPS